MVLLFSSSWVTHLAGMGFDFIVIDPLLLFCCSFFFCLWTWGILFLVGSSILLSMVVPQLVAILMISQEEMSTHPSISTILNRSPQTYI